MCEEKEIEYKNNNKQAGSRNRYKLDGQLDGLAKKSLTLNHLGVVIWFVFWELGPEMGLRFSHLY